MTARRHLVSLAVAAEMLDVTTRTLRRRIAENRLRAYRVGGVIKVDVNDLDDLLVPIGRVA